MTFRAMSTTSFLLLAGGVSASVLVLYLLKLRRPRIVVPFAQLWHAVLAEGERRTLFDRLRNVASLFLQLLLALLIVLALADPRFASSRQPMRRTVIVLDGSASMAARTSDGRSAFEIAVLDASSRARALAAAGEVSVVLAATNPEPLAAFTADGSVLAGAFKRAKVVAAPAGMAKALRYARAALAGAREPKVIVFSDRALNDAEKKALGAVPFELSGVGQRGPNAGIIRFAVRRLPSSPLDVEGIVAASFPQPFPGRVEIRIEDISAEPRLVEIIKPSGGRRLERTFRFTSEDAMKLRARLARAGGGRYADALDADNAAYAYLPSARRRSVLVVGGEKVDFFLARSLASNPLVEARRMTVEQFDARPHVKADVVLFDRVLPRRPPSGPSLFLAPPAREGAFLQVTESLPLPRVGARLSSHPIMRGLVFRDLNLETASVIKPEKGDVALLRCAADVPTPLVFLRPSGGSWWLVVCFDPSSTELPLRADWPLFMANAIGFLAGSPERRPSSVPTGRAVSFDVPPGVTAAELLSPAGVRMQLPVTAGRCAFSPVEAGFYTLKFADSEIVVGASLADEDETNLPSEGAPRRLRSPAVLPALGVNRPWSLLVALALVGIALEWLTYHRRITS